MRRLAAVAVIVGASAALAAQFVLPDGLAVGVVRGDGLFVGVGTWRDGAWRPLTRYEGRSDRLALTPEARRLDRQGWQLTPLGNGTTRPLTLSTDVVAQSHCNDLEGFTTDAPREEVPESSPTPKIGVAVLGAPFERVQAVAGAADGDTRRVSSLIVQLVQAFEGDAVRSGQARRVGALTAKARAGGRVRVTQLVRAALTEETQYYFEARKDYAGVRDYVWASGFVTQGRFPSLRIDELRSRVAGRGESVANPSIVLGVIRLRDRLVWLIEEHGYEGEGFVLVDLAAGGRVLAVAGGGC